MKCERCGYHNQNYRPNSDKFCLAFALTALIFYIPANFFPFMTVDIYGSHSTSTIWQGVVSLTEQDSWLIAVVIFLASIVIPFVKLLILLYLGLRAKHPSHNKFKTRIYNFVEAIGRWSMLDIFLLALTVTIMKLGPWTAAFPEPGALFFLFVVIFSMLASAYFDPQILWRDENGQFRPTEN